jgi:hypothetical protein
MWWLVILGISFLAAAGLAMALYRHSLVIDRATDSQATLEWLRTFRASKYDRLAALLQEPSPPLRSGPGPADLARRRRRVIQAYLREMVSDFSCLEQCVLEHASRDERLAALCEEIVARRLAVRWKIWTLRLSVACGRPSLDGLHGLAGLADRWAQAARPLLLSSAT